MSSPSRPVDLTATTFEKAVEDSSVLIVDCWAPWCRPCLAFAPVFEQAVARHPDVTFAKVNTQAEPRLAAGLGIQAIPTLMVFRDQILVFAQAGMLRASQLDDLLTQVKALDMNEVRAEIAKQEGAGAAPPA
jgi:thioredoxin 2